MPRPDTITLTLDRSFLEHPQGVHLRRMRTALWLYLALLARLPEGTESIEVNVADLAASMGLKDGTVRSWLGHLRRSRYIGLRRLNGSVVVTFPKRLRSAEEPDVAAEAVEGQEFSVAHVQRALGESGNDEALATALTQAKPHAVQRALAGALAPAASEIRRSRTALFLYLLKRYAHATEDHPRS